MSLSTIIAAPSLELATQLSLASEHYKQYKGEAPLIVLSSFNNYNQFVAAAKEYRPELLIIDERLITPNVLPLLRSFVADMLNTANDASPSVIVVIIDQIERESLFAQAGIQNCIVRPTNLNDPNEAIIFIDKLLALRENTIAALRVERSSTLYLDQKPRIGTISRQIIGIWSPKGGVGKTTVSISLSVALAFYGNAKTLLVDSDMNVGDIHSILELDYEKNLYGLATTFNMNQALTYADLENFLERYPKSRIPLYILPGIVRHVLGGQPILTGKKGAELAAAIINVIRESSDFAYVVVDIGQKISEGMHYEWLRSADLVLIVCTSENTTAREVYDAVETFRKDPVFLPRLRNQRFRILFNRWDDRHGLDKAAFLKVTQLVEIATIPEDHSGEVTREHNLGRSIIIDNPTHPFTQAIIQLAEQIDPGISEAHALATGAAPAAKGKIVAKEQPRKRLFGVF